MRRSLLAVGLAAAAVLVAERSASAYERQQHLGLTAGGALSSTDNAGTSPGIDFGLRYTYGLTDAFNFIADVSGMALTTETAPAKNVPPQPGVIATGGVGIAYIFDVTRWVPYAGALVGPAYLGGGLIQSPVWTFDAQVVAGLDYQVSRSWSVGGAYSQHLLALKMSTYSELATLGLHVDYVWGW
jgi:hypothetical protein